MALWIVVLAAAGAVAAIVLAPEDDVPDGVCGPALTDLAAGAFPDACWRPYAADSPFNRPIRDEPRIDPRSDAIVGALRREQDGAPGRLVAGYHDTELDFAKPVYFAREGDPTATVTCTKAWGRCVLEGRRIPLPRGARPAAGGDGHLTIVDLASGWEYDLWQARVDGDRIETSWGGRTKLDGDGLGSDAVAARFGSLAGIVRPEELAAGRVEHALFATVPCGGRGPRTGRTWVPPAGKRAALCDDGPTDGPLMGTRMQLAMTDEEIDATGAPAWKRALLRAMAEYGVIFGDTGGPAPWGIQLQSDTTYTARGEEPRLERFARSNGWTPFDEPEIGRQVRVADLGADVDWSRLRVVHPCESQGDCPAQ